VATDIAELTTALSFAVGAQRAVATAEGVLGA